MRRFLLVWLVVSLAATAFFAFVYDSGGNFYQSVRTSEERTMATRSPGSPAGDGIAQSPPATSAATENLALTISIASSIVSALAAIMQTWLTHRAMRGRNLPPRA